MARRTHSRPWCLVGAAFLGFAISVKYTVIFGAVPLFILLCFVVRKQARPVRLGVIAVAVIIAIGGTWPARDLVLTGNPAYPGSPPQAGTLQVAHSGSLSQRIELSLTTPWRAHFAPEGLFASRLSNPMGVFLLLFWPVWLLPGGRQTPLLRYAMFFIVLYLLYWVAVWPVLRFGVGAIFLFAVLTAVRLHAFSIVSTRLVRALIMFALAYSVCFSLSALPIIELNLPMAALLAHQIDESTYLDRALLTHRSLEWLHGRASSSDLVLSAGNCSAQYAPFPQNFQCLPQADEDVPHIGAALNSRAFRFLIVKNTYAIDSLRSSVPRGIELVGQYRDSNFSIYKLQPKEGL